LNTEAAFNEYLSLARRLVRRDASIEAIRCVASSLRLHSLPDTVADVLENACRLLEEQSWETAPPPEVRELQQKKENLDDQVRGMAVPSDVDPRVERAVDWTRVWMRALPAAVYRALQESELDVLRWILARVMADQPVHPLDIPVPEGMRSDPFLDV